MPDYDYVIVGAGSAGCVLAYRLSQNPKHRVLLIEAGPVDSNPMIHMPKGFARLYADPSHVWYFPVEPDGGRNQPEVWLRGKVLGGSSSVNGMVYMRGQAANYDDWAARGLEGWGWSDMLAAFRAVEDHGLGASDQRGAGGPLSVTPEPQPHPLGEAIIAAANAMGLPRRPDINTDAEEGVGYTIRTIKRGRRQSAAVAFLRPAQRRSNLAIVTDAMVDRVVFEGGRAGGVTFSRDGVRETVRAQREVILCAGALMSPVILQRSGVGPPDRLRQIGVEVVADRPMVGRNLLEHRMLALQFRLRGRLVGQNREHQGARLAGNLLKYYLAHRGVLAKASHDMAMLLKSDPSLAAPDIQILASPVNYATPRSAGGGIALDDKPGMHFIGHPIQPRSRGEVMARAADPATPPEIHAGYMSDPRDRRMVIFVTDFIRRLVRQPALAPYVEAELSPGEAVVGEDLVAACVRGGNAGYHAVGTCAMGADPDAVVDHRLRVRGVSRVRVVDCSVMPTIPSGNTNSPAMAVAWRAADFILQDAAA
jgi:choline dehydrogenase